MSIPVSIEELPSTLERYPWGYLVTVADSGRAHSLAVPTDWRDGVLHAAVGRSSAANATARPDVTMVFPGADGTQYSLIVDGTVTVEDAHVAVRPTWAVLHRPALPE